MTSEMLHAHMAKANAETALTKKFQEALTRSKRQKRQARKKDPEQERAELQGMLYELVRREKTPLAQNRKTVRPFVTGGVSTMRLAAAHHVPLGHARRAEAVLHVLHELLEAVGAPAVAQRPPLLARRLVVQLHLGQPHMACFCAGCCLRGGRLH